jgi:hypothetical protein
METEKICEANLVNKLFFVGISLGSCATSESGVAVLDRNLNIITLDKLFSIDDIRFFLNNFVGKQNAVINISLPENPQMLNAKWKLLSRQYQLIQSCELINQDNDWINRYSNRGCDFFVEMKNKGIDIFRFDVRDLKLALGLSGIYKDRSPADCKALQSSLKFRFKLRDLPANMLPVSQLEALLGAYLGILMVEDSIDIACKVRSEYKDIEVVGIDV